MRDQSDIFTTLGPQAQQRADEIGQRRTRNAYQEGESAQTWLSASIVVVAVFGDLGATTMLASIRVGFCCRTASPTQSTGLARLSSGLAVGGATSGNHKSGSKLAIGETKQETW